VVLFVNVVTYRLVLGLPVDSRKAVSSPRATESYPCGTPQGVQRRGDRPTAL